MDILSITKSLVEALGRNDIKVFRLLREFCNVVIRALARASAQDLARKERNVAIQSKILNDIVIDFLHL